jgi:hypothetical protein
MTIKHIFVNQLTKILNTMKRFTITITFKSSLDKIVEHFKTRREAISYKDILDETVETALLKDNVTGKIEKIKNI